MNNRRWAVFAVVPVESLNVMAASIAAAVRRELRFPTTSGTQTFRVAEFERPAEWSPNSPGQSIDLAGMASRLRIEHGLPVIDLQLLPIS